MTAVDVETDVTVLKSLDFPIVCTVRIGYSFLFIRSRPEECGRPASWLMICRGCDRQSYCCDEHAAAVKSLARVFCAACTATAPGGELFTWHPLGGA